MQRSIISSGEKKCSGTLMSTMTGFPVGENSPTYPSVYTIQPPHSLYLSPQIVDIINLLYPFPYDGRDIHKVSLGVNL